MDRERIEQIHPVAENANKGYRSRLKDQSEPVVFANNASANQRSYCGACDQHGRPHRDQAGRKDDERNGSGPFGAEDWKQEVEASLGVECLSQQDAQADRDRDTHNHASREPPRRQEPVGPAVTRSLAQYNYCDDRHRGPYPSKEPKDNGPKSVKLFLGTKRPGQVKWTCRPIRSDAPSVCVS